MNRDRAFSSSVAGTYESHLVPMLFEPYAADIVRRLAGRTVAQVIEIAAGTGAVTRALVSALPEARVVATDLNGPMLDVAKALTPGPVDWVQADAQRLPFDDASCDAVVCQFGLMFFPDKPAAFAEARRVLRPGGVLLFNVWDRLEENEFAHVVTGAVASLFPSDPPAFLRRTPHGYHDRHVIAADLARAGFTEPAKFEQVASCSRAASALSVAAAYCVGSPLRHEIEARDPRRLDDATAVAADAISRRFGAGPVEGAMQALVITVTKDRHSFEGSS